MFHRIIDLSESSAYLRADGQRLIIERDQKDYCVPFAELGVVIAAHPRITCSRAAISGLAAHGGTLVVCDEKRMPVAMLLPLDGHYTQGERFARQAAVKPTVRKRLWQQIVRAKIAAQADLLEAVHGDDYGLRPLVGLVRSGDPANVEARAARRYWDRLFGSIGFRRDRSLQDHNALLNYGYAILRAIVARAVCGAGLHPSLGLHHHNRYNAFALCDDLMEPFRVVVDRAVVDRMAQRPDDEPLGRDDRGQILTALTGRCQLEDQQVTLFDALTRVCQSLVDVILGQRRTLLLPGKVVDAAP